MVRLTFTLLLLLAFSGYTHGQMIENFEHIEFNMMLGNEEEDDSRIVVVQDEVRGYVAEFHRSQHGVPWGGFWSALPEPVDMTARQYVHVDVWKPRISGLRFKIEGGTTDDFELEPVEAQTLTEEWETITFHFPDAEGQYTTIAFMPDFEDPLDLNEDITIYFDNIRLSDNAEPGAGDEVVIEDFDFIIMNPMLGEPAEDDSEFRIVPNPAPDDVNDSPHVVEFRRSQHGVPWGGFWADVPQPVDLNENQYVYVMVWKPRVSPLRFKLEQGPGDPIEIEPMFPQTESEQWEEIVFDFSEYEGQWNRIVFMPDFEDPLELNEDIVIYFDQIRLGEAPTDVSVIRFPDRGLDLKVYPNPATSNVTVESPVNSSISLIDIAGNLVYQQTAVNPVTTIDLNNVPAGLYLVRVVDGSSVRTIKLIVQ
jgi:hypothetical protein